jgi:transcriptional regulator with XRE-family HTH domain
MSHKKKPRHAVARLRDETGMSRAEFADALQVPLRTMESYLEGLRPPPPTLADDIQAVFNVSAAAIMADGPLVTPSGKPWSMQEVTKFSTEFQAVWAEVNALFAGAALAAIYASAAQRQQMPLATATVAKMLRDLQDKFGICQETLASSNEAKNRRVAKLQKELDRIQMADFKRSALFGAMDAGGVFTPDGSDGPATINLPADLAARAAAFPGETVKMSGEYWAKRRAAPVKRPRVRKPRAKD